MKTTEMGGERGADLGKKVVVRQRFVAVDTLGMLWALLVVLASVQDRAGASPEEKLRSAVKRSKVLWGDSHFDKPLGHA